MSKKKNHLLILLALLISILFTATSYAEEITGDEDRTLAPYFFIEDADSSIDSFPLKETKVSTTINGIIADTYVVQSYANEGKKPINASYVFPASTKVTIHGMKMEIGDQVITAKIKEREEAKQEFEEAKNEGKSGSLLEEQRPNVFTMDVANIMPGDLIRVELHYTEIITPTEGTYQFVFPTVVGPRYASLSADSNAETNQWLSSAYLKNSDDLLGKYEITVNLSTGVPITDLSCKSHKTDITWDNESSAKVTLSNPEEFAGSRDYILEYKLTGEEVNCGLMLNAGESENFFMLMIQPPERYKPEDIPPREYIFVLDVSGSMDGFPLDTAKKLINNLVTNLRESDRFNLLLFSDELISMSPASVNATTDNIKSAIALIDQQNGGGGTELSMALESAVALPMDHKFSRSIITITDGYVSNETSVLDIINKNLADTNFFSFGIGDSVNRYLIEGIAKSGLGESFIVTDSKEAVSTAERFRVYIQSPILTDIQVSYSGFETYDIEPPKISTLFAQKPIILFGKWRGEAAGTIRISGKTGNKEYVQDIPVSGTIPSEKNEAIRYLWARTKVERLSSYGCSQDNEDAKEEITAIGLNYNMVTPYTSFIAVNDTIRNKDSESTDVNQPLPLPSNVSDLAVGGYTTGSEPGSIIFIFIIMSLVLIQIRYRMRKKRRVI